MAKKTVFSNKEQKKRHKFKVSFGSEGSRPDPKKNKLSKRVKGLMGKVSKQLREAE